ncbi:alpha/beta hydrolase-fold protein [Mycolicibacterium chubuense]|nr:alpha/beta hydrolase-fold protein [Mycolicibacterium chubuense]
MARTPLRVAHRLTGGGADPEPAEPLDSGELVVVGAMPEGVPRAALQPEPRLPSPAHWPFGEHFPRTCGTGRLAAGAVYWTDFVYDDHGACGVRVKMSSGRVVPPEGTYVYPDGPAAGNGADIFRVAIGLTETHTWWRIDWNTLLDPSVPIAVFTLDTGRGRQAGEQWPAGVGLRSAGIDVALLISAAGATLIDLATGSTTTVEHMVDPQSRSFLARVPRTLIEPTGTWTVRLASGLANESGDAFAEVPAERGSETGQPNAYNVAFRTCEQESAHHNFWSDRAQAAALADGDVSQFSLAVPWDRLASGAWSDEPLVTGISTRWYVSSVELGQGVADSALLATEPQFLGRVQPYSVCLPSSYEPGRALPLTLLLHSIAMGQNQFAAVDGTLLDQVCEGRDSVVASPLGRGPACWFLDEGELDVWEVWARVAEQLGTDPNRTVIAGYSMGGYAAYRLSLTYPSVFAQAVVLAGALACGIRLLPGIDLPADIDPDSHCAHEGETWRLLPNARWLPFVIAHGLLDEFVPFLSVAQQVLKLDRLGYRYYFTTYPAEDHVSLALRGKFDDAVEKIGTGSRAADPTHITFRWYPRLERPDIGIGPHRVWWISGLRAVPELASRRGGLATVDARSYARPEFAYRSRRRGGVELTFKPTPRLYTQRMWQRALRRDARAHMTLTLTGVAAVTVDLDRAGLAALPRSTIEVVTDSTAEITLHELPLSTAVDVDGEPQSGTVIAGAGRHLITLTDKSHAEVRCPD